MVSNLQIRFYYRENGLGILNYKSMTIYLVQYNIVIPHAS